MYSSYTQQLENQFLAEQRKRIGFFGTFAKFATELANDLLMLKADEEKCQSSNWAIFIEKYESKIYGGSNTPKRSIPNAVLRQILMLTFSFAARLVYALLAAANVMFDFDIFDWKFDLEVLFTAFKFLSADQNTATNTDLGIFPYRFVSTNNHWEISVREIGERIQQNVDSVDYYSTEQMQYIENFKFVLQLSEYSLTPFEVHQILKKIQNETIISQNDQSQQPAELYAFLKQFLLPKIGDGLPKCGKISCIFVHFGRHLFRQVDFFYSGDTWHMEYEKTRNFFFENYCNTMSVAHLNEALLKKVFNEQVRYFAYAIKIDYDYCRELSQIAEGLHKILNNELVSSRISRSSTYNIYSCSSSSPMSRFKWDLDIFVKNVPKFGQILFETLHEATKSVKYDGTTQLMALPVSLGEHLLGRLYTVVQMLNSSICQIGENVDFVITIMPTKVNSQLFKLLFSLAIRLSAQLEKISDEGVNVPIRKSEFCLLVNFSNDLLERIMKNRKNQNILFNGVEPIEVTISEFELIKQELCSDAEHSGANLINNYFGENLVQYAKAVKIEFDPYKEMNQIVPILKNEIQKMFRNKDWDYATFDCMHTIEWNLLRIDLAKMGQSRKWKQMEKLLKEWRILYNNWVLNKSEMKRPNFAKIMRKIVQNLEMMSRE
ncbi:hypothetical protein niasHS_017972 [Heterodera schachtii]|uniref:Uncharacterized protein n=1 Tax=Heterodera schachtii TaxID=97005 RepID=A0ABD2IA16_HETSC